MGYILPIQHLTYNDYQKRIQPKNVNHFHIHGPYPIVKTENQKFTFGQMSDHQERGSTNIAKYERKGQRINLYV